MKCQKCGNELHGTDKFCPQCGTPVKQTPMENPTQGELLQQPVPPQQPIMQNPNVTTKPTNKKFVIAIIIAGIAALTILLCAVGLVNNANESSKTIKTTEPTLTVDSTISTTEKATENVTVEVTEKQTEEVTEKPTEKTTEAPKITNNTSANGFWAQGNGDYVADGLNVTNFAVLHLTHNGSSNFIVTLYKNDEYEDLLVNAIGGYSGDILIEGSGDYELEINADGDWNVTSDGLSIDDTTSFSGTGDSVTGITSHSGGKWHITNSGQSNFIVVEYGLSKGYMDLLVNEIGDYDGIVKAKSGDNIFFEVKSEGSWTIEKN